MKRFFLILASILLFSNIYAQKCGVNHQWFNHQISIAKKSLGKTYIDPSPSNIKHIPLAVHFIKRSDGSFSKHNDITVFYHSITQTNRILNKIGVQFFISSVNYINNSNYLDINISYVGNPDSIDTQKTPGAANVFIIDDFTDGASGYGSPNCVYLSDITEGTVPHEFGHFMNLAHTHDANTVELVDGSNCTTAGDNICDTPADIGGNYTEIPNCVYSKPNTDANGQVYTPLLDNIMSYWGGMCGYTFTQGQYDRMAASIATYHSAYTATEEISSTPSGVSITSNGGYDLLQWTEAVGSKGTQIEYSNDAGATWHVMNGVLPGINSYIISNTIAGENYKIRLRHLNSTTYTATIDYNPTISSVDIPVITQNATYGIKHVLLDGTNVDYSSNGNEYYTIETPVNDVELFKGGSYKLHLTPDAYLGRFTVFLDENCDGDFDDAGERKYVSPDNGDHWSVTVDLNINQNSTQGYSRLRIRTNFSQNENGATNFYNWSETEDYVVKIVSETAPSNLSASYNSVTESVDLSWTDTYNTFKYLIERSVDGINYQQIGTTSDGISKTFNDTSSPPSHQVEYRIKRQGGNLYSENIIIYTDEHNRKYCTPQSVNACGSNYGISKVSISSLSFENTSTASCGKDGNGYSNYYSTHSMSFSAGAQYTIDIENSAFNYSKDLSIFIDFNQNGQFDVNEKVYNQTSQSAGPISSCTISIPSDAVNGETRMRIRNYYNSITDACSSTNFGETEDYKVVISGGREIEVTNARAENPSLNSIELNWGISTGASPTGFIIKQSTDGTNFSQIASLTSSDRTYTVSSLNSGTKYWFQIIESGSINSNPKTIWNSTLSNLSNDDKLLENEFKIYPIPFEHGQLKIESINNINYVNVIDLQGKIILEKSNPSKNGSSYLIDNIPNGVYILKIKSDKGEISKIIKSKY